MKHLSTAALAVLATLGLGASTASAAPKSWAAAKAVLPDDVNVLAGANLAALRATALYQQIVPRLIEKEDEAKLAFDMARATCNIDLHTVIDDATVAIAGDERGVVVLGLGRGIDQKKVIDCLNKLSVQMAKDKPADPTAKAGLKKAPPKVSAKTTGKVTEYSISGEPKKLYLAWLAKDVVAISTDADDKALLDKMIGGKGARTLGAVMTKVNTNASVWLATTKTAPMQQTANATVKSVSGTVDAAQGNVNVDMRAQMGSATEAKKLVDDATAMVAAAKSQVPPQFAKIVDSLRLGATGADATVTLSVPEKDLLTILSLVMSSL